MVRSVDPDVTPRVPAAAAGVVIVQFVSVALAAEASREACQQGWIGRAVGPVALFAALAGSAAEHIVLEDEWTHLVRVAGDTGVLLR